MDAFLAQVGKNLIGVFWRNNAMERMMLQMTCRRLICFSLLSLLLASCSPGQNTGSTSTNTQPAQSEADRQAAEAKLARMLEARRQKQAEQEEQQRIADEKAAAAEAEANKPHYDPERLRMAVKWRQWADITVPDLNIHAWMKSNWKNGIMHMRLALLGDKTALRLFTGSWKYIRLVFADQSGTNLHQAILSTNDLHWDENNLRNSGTPTMEFEGDSEVSLEVYESIVQWNLKWENDVQ